MFRDSARPTRSLARLAIAATVAAAAAGLGGCYSEGGLGWSEDQYVYVSRPHQPWAVVLVDTRTGDEFWKVEVPVGKQLVMHFVRDAGTDDSYTPDLMEWAIMNEGDEWERLANTMPVPPANARRIDPVLRPTPELPPDMTKALSPSPPRREGQY